MTETSTFSVNFGPRLAEATDSATALRKGLQFRRSRTKTSRSPPRPKTRYGGQDKVTLYHYRAARRTQGAHPGIDRYGLVGRCQ